MRPVVAAIRELWASLSEDMGPECVEWPGMRSPHGYGHTKRNGQSIASRAVWVQVFGPIPDGLVVCHHCDNPPCVNPSHLFLGTMRDNVMDMMSKGRQVAPVNEGNGKTKLSVTQVREIREAVAAGETRKAVALRYGVHSAHVSRLVRGLRRAAA